MTNKLYMDNDGHIGLSIENVENFANYYLSLVEKLKLREENLSEDDRLYLMLLLKETATKMLENPSNFLKKKNRGRPNENTNQRIKRTMCMFYALGLARNLEEARAKTATHLDKSLDAIEKGAKGLTLAMLKSGKY